MIVYTPPCISNGAKRTRGTPNHKKKQSVPCMPSDPRPSETIQEDTVRLKQKKNPDKNKRNNRPVAATYYACDEDDVT